MPVSPRRGAGTLSIDFKSELLRLLHAHRVEIDERYVFD
jgi:hypothetical protein